MKDAKRGPCHVAAKKATKKAAPKRSAKRAPAKKAPGSAAGSRITGLKKAEGKGPVQAYFAKIPPEHRAIGERIDKIVEKTVPDVRRAIKWSSPMWGLEGRGWFAAFGSFKNYTKVNFFKGAALKPQPPEGEGKEMRSVNIATLADLDEKQMASWLKQAAAMPGWGKN